MTEIRYFAEVGSKGVRMVRPATLAAWGPGSKAPKPGSEQLHGFDMGPGVSLGFGTTLKPGAGSLAFIVSFGEYLYARSGEILGAVNSGGTAAAHETKMTSILNGALNQAITARRPVGRRIFWSIRTSNGSWRWMTPAEYAASMNSATGAQRYFDGAGPENTLYISICRVRLAATMLGWVFVAG